MTDVATPEAATSQEPVVDTPVVEAPVVKTVEPTRRGRRSSKDREREVRESSTRRREAQAAAIEDPAAEPTAEVSEGTPEPVEPVVEIPAIEDPAAEPTGDVTPEPVVSEGEPVGEPVADPAVEPVADPAVEPVEDPAARPEKREFIAVPIDVNHPASQGQTEIRVADEQSARLVRAYENSNAKQVQINLDKVKEELAEKNEQLATLYDRNDRTEADKVAWTKWESSEDGKKARAEYHRLEEMEKEGDLAPGTASLYWRGASQGYQETAKAEYQTRADARAAKAQEAQAEVDAQKTERWIAETATHQKYLPEAVRNHPEYQMWFDRSLKQFDAALRDKEISGVAAGDAVGMHRAFKDFFRKRLFLYDNAVAAMQSSRTQQSQVEKTAADKAAAQAKHDKEVAEAAVKKHMESIAARQKDVPRHPLGNLAPVSRDRTPSDAPDSGQTDLAKAHPRNRRKAGEEAARLDARNRLAGA